LKTKYLLSGLLAISLSITGLGGRAAQNDRKLLPVDEASSRPDFLKFRTQLQAAVARHDMVAVLDVLDPEIKNSFGGDDRIEGFKEIWQIKAPDTKLWKELGAVLALGGSFDGANEFTAPYVFSKWPDDIDAFEYVAVIGSNVRIRTAPSSTAPTAETVSYAILQLDEETLRTDWMHGEWTAVKVNGRKAYIATRLIRSPIDYRARFTYSDRRWRLSIFLAGD